MNFEKLKKKIVDIFTYTALIIMSIITVFPLIFMLTSSLKTPNDITRNPGTLIPKQFTLYYYKEILVNTDFLKYVGNSLKVAFSVTFISIVLSAFAAYAIVRFYPKWGKRITRGLMMCYMFPPIVLSIPYFMVMSKLGFANTIQGLVLVYLSFTIPFSIWLLIGHFRSIPVEIEEAARIDGASRFKTFITIVIPLSAPGLVSTAIFAFINAWNEFLYSLVLINTGDKRTVAVGLYSLIGGETLHWGDMMAASTMVVLPSLIFFFFIQKHIAGGLTGGAVKA